MPPVIAAAIAHPFIAAAAVGTATTMIKQLDTKTSISPISPAVAAIPESAKETAAETIAASQATAQAATQARQRRARRSRSIFTSPLGLEGEATTIRKTLLGE